MTKITEAYNPTTGQMDMVAMIVEEAEGGGDTQKLIRNSIEPSNSDALRDPAEANYYEGDDYLYFFVNGRWKRVAISFF